MPPMDHGRVTPRWPGVVTRSRLEIWVSEARPRQYFLFEALYGILKP